MVQPSQATVFAQECHPLAFSRSVPGDEGALCEGWPEPGLQLAQNILPIRGAVRFVRRPASEMHPALSESSPALAEAGSETQGVVSLAHSLLFGCLWQRDPNNLDMCLYKKNWEWDPKWESGAGQLVEEPR